MSQRGSASPLGCVLLLASSAAGCGYVVKPLSYAYYDDQCQIESRRMTLTVEQEFFLSSTCTNESDCAALLIANLAVTPVSAIVSGSIVLVGNTVYWLQKIGQCRPRPPTPAT